MVNQQAGATEARRAALKVAGNPASWHDYLIRWSGRLADGTRLAIDHVPDRQVLEPEAFAAYLAKLEDGLEAGCWPSLESLVVAVLDDFNNELVPRWVRITGHRLSDGIHHDASVDDRQPDWDNPRLLARLGSGFARP